MSQTEHPKTVDATNLPLCISGDRTTPAYLQLAGQLQGLIRSRALRTGNRLPSTRALARMLGINRNTVVAAFEHLTNAGLVETRGRGGTLVSDISPSFARGGVQSSTGFPARKSPSKAAERRVEPVIDFRLGSTDPTPLPVEVWRRACREAGRHLPPANYGDPRGDADLRNQIALYLGRTRALRVEPDQLVITAGAGQAIDRIAEALLRPNDRAAVEEPGYPRAARAFSRQGARLTPIPVDDDGIDVANLCSRSDAPRLLHVTPSHQYPLGARLSSMRRTQLLRFARERNVVIIENDYDGEFRYGSPPLPALAAMAGFAA